MRCSLLLLAISVVLGNVHHISPELLHHEPLLEANSAWGFGAMHSGSSVLCSVEGHTPRRHFANTHSFPGAPSRGWTTQTCAPDDGLPEHGSKQPHVLALDSSSKFGGLHATSTLGRTFVYLIDYVRAERTHRAHAALHLQARSLCHTALAIRIASTPATTPPPTYHLPYMQALTVMGEMHYINMMLMVMLCPASLLMYAVTIRHNARGKQIPPR